jgi:2-dehydropantoate 2-reductase
VKLTILGAGAVGCFYGAALARAGNMVTLIGRPEQVEAIRRRGLRFESPTFSGFVPIHAITDPAEAAPADIALLCVKSQDTESAGRSLAGSLAATATVFSFQNGVENAERLQALLRQTVVPAAVYVAAETIAPGEVKHHGHGDVELGPSAASDTLGTMLRDAGIQVRISQNIRATLWQKLVTNCCYNALSAIAQTPYGRLVNAPAIRDVIRDLVEECRSVAAASGIVLPADLLERVLAIADAMPGQVSSTAQDLLRHKPSEIDHLNGYIVRKGTELGIPTPVNRALFALFRLIESTIDGGLDLTRPH